MKIMKTKINISAKWVMAVALSYLIPLTSCLFISCSEDDDNGSANVGLGIKTFFPTKVVANQPMTINGSGFDAATEIEFPGGQKVTSFEIVSNDMIKVNAPSGIAADGGKLVVRTANDQAESKQELTLGHTMVSGFSKQEGESAAGGELITVYGTDLEFINSVELLDPDSVPQLIDHKDFYRKGTSNLIFRVPLKNIYKGSFVGYLHTYDGQTIALPELAYEPASNGGHWETVKTTIWKNEGSGPVSWSGTYRFSNVERATGEEIYAIPMDIWERMKTETFYLTLEATDPQIRVTTGWWSTTWTGADFQPGTSDLLTDNGDGTWTLEINLSGDPILGAMDVEHLLFTGDRYTPIDIYFKEDIWVEGGGHMEIVKTSLWKNEGAGPVSWNGTYRFSNVERATGEEIYAFPMDIWERIKTETFYLTLEATDPQIRVTTGWWSTTWTGADFQPGTSDLLTDNGDGTWTLEINLSGDPILNAMDVEHLLFTGDRYTPLEIYFKEEVWVDGGGDSGPSETVFWENSGGGAVSWSGTYRFGLDGHDGNNECIATFSEDIWDKIKTSTFYLTVEATDPQIRVTNGWWDTQWLSDFQPGNELLTDNGDGTWTLEINIAGDPLADTIDQKHILFTGDRFTPVKLFFK
jgi:hypothetical protein